MSVDVALRPLVLDDIDDEYCSWFDNKDGHLDFFTGSGRVFDKEGLVADFLEGAESERWFYYLIVGPAGEKIGNVKIGPIDCINRTSDLVCFVGNRRFLGKGLAVKAISIANKIAFEKHDIYRLHGGMYESNVASIKAYTRAGWMVEGRMRGFYLIDGKPEDRVCVACLNPKYFDEDESE